MSNEEVSKILPIIEIIHALTPLCKGVLYCMYMAITIVGTACHSSSVASFPGSSHFSAHSIEKLGGAWGRGYFISVTHWIAVTVLLSDRASAKSAKPSSFSGFELSL